MKIAVQKKYCVLCMRNKEMNHKIKLQNNTRHCYQ